MPVSIIVDAYRLSKDFVSIFQQKGYRCIHIQSTSKPIPDMQPGSTWQREDYITSLIYDGCLESLVSQLKQYDIQCVISGTEPGVELADLLAARFNVTNNGLDKSTARRDKFLMAEALMAAGVPSVKHCKSNNADTIVNWAEQNGTWPVVVKPLRGAATNDVYICHSAEKLRGYCNKIINKENIFCETNQELLVQNFLKGTEYIVDTVSCDGKHFIGAIWQYQKRYTEEFDTIIYDKVLLLSAEGEIQTQLAEYTSRVLDALDIRYGAGHAEIMLTEEGPILVEIGARLGGHMGMKILDACLEHNLIELTVDAYVDPTAFHNKTTAPYKLKNNCLIVYLVSSQEGIIEALPILETIDSLPTLFTTYMQVKVGDYLVKTNDMITTPGKVILINESADLIENDYLKLIKAEPHGYQVRSNTCSRDTVRTSASSSMAFEPAIAHSRDA